MLNMEDLAFLSCSLPSVTQRVFDPSSVSVSPFPHYFLSCFWLFSIVPSIPAKGEILGNIVTAFPPCTPGASGLYLVTNPICNEYTEKHQLSESYMCMARHSASVTMLNPLL